MAAHVQEHALNSTIDHAPGTNNTLLGTEANAVVEKAFGTSAAGSTIVQRQVNGNITLPATDPVLATDAASKAYVDQQITTGVTWKELVLHCDQLKDDPNGGVLQAILAAVATDLTAGDTFVITDGTTTETYTAVAGAPAAFQFQVGGGVVTTTANLVASINANSTLWSAVETDGLDAYLAAANDPQFVVHRADAVDPLTTPDRVYGTLAGGQASIQVVEFATGTQDYREESGTQSDLPGADPGAKRFGFGRLSVDAQTGDTHRCANDNRAFAWDGDDAVWQNTDTGTTVTPGDGIDVTGGKVSTKVVTPVGASTQQFGGITNRRTNDGTGTAAADQGYLAVNTDNVSLVVDQATNQIKLNPTGAAGRNKGFGSWTSSNAADRQPDLSELNAFLGTTAADINNYGFLIESGGGGRVSAFWAIKVANTGALTDYRLVEMTQA